MTITPTLLAFLFIFPASYASSELKILGNAEAHKNFFEQVGKKIFIDVSSQKLYLTNGKNQIIDTYIVSTGKNGTGERPGSFKTPRGIFSVENKIGHNSDPMMRFKGRMPIGHYKSSQSRYDNILSRILTLDGKQKHNKNTLQRYVYIHGTSAIERLGKKPVSLGCIRMCPYAITTFFNQVSTGTPVYIYDKKNPLPWEKKSKVLVMKSNTVLAGRKDYLKQVHIA